MAEPQKKRRPWVPVAATAAVMFAIGGPIVRQWWEQRSTISVAVLPFPGAAELRNTLASVEHVRVLGPTTSAAFPAEEAKRRELAEQLSIRYLVFQDGDRVKALDWKASREAWSGGADADAMLRALGVKLKQPVRPFQMQEAARQAEQGVRAIDRLEGNWKARLDELDSLATQALAKDEAQPDAHLAKAVVLMLRDYKWEESELQLRRTLELRPADAMAARWYAHHLDANGRANDAIDAMRRALAVDPLAPEIAIPLTLIYMDDKQYSVAREHLAQCAKFFPGHPALPVVDAFLRRAQNDFKGALAAIQPAMGHPATRHLAIPLAAEFTARVGQKAEAATLLATAPAESPADLVGFAQLAIGNQDAGFEALRRGAAERSPTLMLLHGSPVFEQLQKDGRYQKVAAGMRLLRK